MPEKLDLRSGRKEMIDNLILQYLSSKGETGCTLRDLANHFGFNYYTARNHIVRLAGEKKAEIAPSAERSTYYRAVHYGGMPMVDSNNSLWDVVTTYADPARNSPSTEATRQIMYSFAELFSLAERYANGGSVSRKQLQEIRERLLANKATLKNLTEVIDTVLNTRDLWHSNDSLKKALLEDPNHPVTTAQTSEAFSNHVARYESNKGTP